MLSERLVRAHPERIREGLRRRAAGMETLAALDRWLALDVERRALASEHDQLAGQGGEPSALRAARARLKALEDEQRLLLARIPNVPRDDVPDGQDASGNVELRRWGTPPSFDFAPKRHDELATALGILDLPRATKLAGPRFPLLVGDGARLLRSLAALLLDLHRERGYIEVAPPHLLRTALLEGTGHLPRYAEDLYQLPADALALSPTAGDATGGAPRRGDAPRSHVAAGLHRLHASIPARGRLRWGAGPWIDSPASVRQSGAGAHRGARNG